MATLEDKILGEKLHNYCSSSESENDDNESDSEKSEKQPPEPKADEQSPEIDKWEGTSTNTGPKGVLKDWQRYKQLESEKRSEDEKQKIEMMKKLTLSVQTALDEEKEALDDPELAELLNDDFLVNYQKQRMQEMLQQTNHNLKFGELIMLNDSQEFLDAIDKEHKSVKIIIHIYEDNVDACRTMNACLKELCKQYVSVKFCAIVGSRAGMSKRFKSAGVPALLVYKNGQLVGNFVGLSNELGNDFYPEDVQGFLVEHGMLEDKTLTPQLIRSTN